MMELVSKTFLRRLLLTLLLAGTLFGERAALADVLLDPLDQAVWPLIALAPLGPITSAGRISWYCQPEHAARSPRWQGAGLPPSVGKP
jgi:hypothetical protein